MYINSTRQLHDDHFKKGNMINKTFQHKVHIKILHDKKKSNTGSKPNKIIMSIPGYNKDRNWTYYTTYIMPSTQMNQVCSISFCKISIFLWNINTCVKIVLVYTHIKAYKFSHWCYICKNWCHLFSFLQTRLGSKTS